MQSSACVDISFVGLVCTSGWRPDQPDKCVLCVKLESVEIKLSHYTAAEATGNRIPEKEPPLGHKDRDQNLKIVVDFKALVLGMGDSRCHLE